MAKSHSATRTFGIFEAVEPHRIDDDDPEGRNGKRGRPAVTAKKVEKTFGSKIFESQVWLPHHR